MKIGYMRVSTEEQKLDLQEDALRAAGCEKLFCDKASGAKEAREGLQEALANLREGDCLVVYKLDRLARSLKHLIEVVTALKERNIGLVSVQENIDTNTPGGRLVFHLFGALAEFERELIRERTRSGLTAARARGKHGGRPRILSDKQLQVLRTLQADASLSVRQICNMMSISKTTYYRCAENLPG